MAHFSQLKQPLCQARSSYFTYFWPPGPGREKSVIRQGKCHCMTNWWQKGVYDLLPWQAIGVWQKLVTERSVWLTMTDYMCDKKLLTERCARLTMTGYRCVTNLRQKDMYDLPWQTIGVWQKIGYRKVCVTMTARLYVSDKFETESDAWLMTGYLRATNGKGFILLFACYLQVTKGNWKYWSSRMCRHDFWLH